MLAGRQPQLTVIAQAGRPSPYHHVPMDQRNLNERVLAPKPSELNHGRQPKGHGDNRRRKIPFISVPMQPKFRPWLVPIDQTHVRQIPFEAGCGGGPAGQPTERLRQGRPRPTSQRVKRAVPIPRLITPPPHTPAVAHGHRHLKTARGPHGSHRRLCQHGLQRSPHGLLHPRQVREAPVRQGRAPQARNVVAPPQERD